MHRQEVAMGFALSETAEKLVVSVTGSLTFHDFNTFMELKEIALNSIKNWIELDLSDVKTMDTAGIGYLILWNEAIREAQKAISFLEPKDMALQILRYVGLQDFLNSN